MVKSGDIRNTLYPDWVEKNFGTIEAVVSLYNHMVKAQWYTKDINSFFAKFACDIYSDSQYCKGVSQSNNTSQNGNNNQSDVNDTQINAVFSCVNNSQILKGIKKSLNSANSVIYKLSTGGQLQFNTDKSFIYISRNDPNRQIKGNWDCNGSNEFIVNAENGARLDSKRGSWGYDVVHKSTTNETDEPTSYIKMGDKGDKVSDIQNLLIKNGYKNISKDGSVDGIFGQRTLSAVKDFQSANKDNQGNPLKVDGIVNSSTMEALNRKTLQENIVKKVITRNLEMKYK